MCLGQITISKGCESVGSDKRLTLREEAKKKRERNKIKTGAERVRKGGVKLYISNQCTKKGAGAWSDEGKRRKP